MARSRIVHEHVEDFGSSFLTKGFTGQFHATVTTEDGNVGRSNNDDKAEALAEAIKDADSKK